MNSRPAITVKKSLHQGRLPVNILELPELLQKHQLSFFDEIQGCVLHGCSFIKTLVHYKPFSQKKRFYFL